MTGLGPYWLNPNDENVEFPDVALALREPNGLLAVGGTLSPKRLLAAYRHGIFPWFSEGQPVLWWSPDPRAVLFPRHIRISRSMRKILRQGLYTCTLDHAFDAVVNACAQPRSDGQGTWITADMFQAYSRLHQLGHAHSVETWYDGKLVGGLYGVAIGKIFFGESMFHLMPNASKTAFIKVTQKLQEWGVELIDCQVRTDHLDSLGAQSLPREEFIAYLNRFCDQAAYNGDWKMAL